MIDYRLMKRFIAVAELGSLNKAALRLNISQPALSKNIHLLEEHYRVALIERRSRGVSLTPFGDILYRHAKWMDADMRRLDGEISTLRDLAMDEVNIGVPPGPGFVTEILPRATSHLSRDSARFNINVQIGTRAALMEPLMRGELDFVVTSLEQDTASEHLVQEKLFIERLTIVVARHHPLLARREVHLTDMIQYPWAIQGQRVQLEDILNRLGAHERAEISRSILRSNSSLFLKAMGIDSEWICFLNHDSVRSEIERRQMFEITVADLDDAATRYGEYPIGLCYNRHAPLSAMAGALIGEIKAAAADLA